MKEIFAWTLELTPERVVEVALQANVPPETIPVEGIIVTSRGDGVISMLVAPNVEDAEQMRPSALEAAVELQGVARLQRFVWAEDIMRTSGGVNDTPEDSTNKN